MRPSRGPADSEKSLSRLCLQLVDVAVAPLIERSQEAGRHAQQHQHSGEFQRFLLRVLPRQMTGGCFGITGEGRGLFFFFFPAWGVAGTPLFSRFSPAPA